MRPALRSLVDRQGGLFARHQALTSGYTRKEFDRMTRGRGRPWVRIRYGIYAERESWDRLDEAAQLRLLDRSAFLVCDHGTVLSHSSAARAHGLPLIDANDRLIHVTRLRLHDRILTGVEAGIKHHGGELADDEIEVIDGLPVTNLVRTTLDCAAEFGYRTGLVMADATLGRGIPRLDLAKSLDRHANDPHHGVRRAVVADADGRAATPIETLGRVLVRAMGISDVEPQHHFPFLDSSDAYVDLYSPRFRHVFECDGKVKYRQQTDWRGVSLTADDVVWLEKQREDRLRGRGLGVSRIIWADTQPDLLSSVSSRIWNEIRSQNAAGLFSPDTRSA